MEHHAELKAGAGVYTASGERVGDVERVVLDPASLVVTHLVVEKGILFKEDRVVAAGNIATADPDRITLKPDVSDALPEFEVKHYHPVDYGTQSKFLAQHPRAYFPYPPAGSYYPLALEPDRKAVVERTVSEDLVALETGAEIVDADEEKAGALDEILTDDAGRATHIVVRGRHLGRELKSVPVGWIDHLHEDHIRLSVSRDVIEELPAYTPPE